MFINGLQGYTAYQTPQKCALTEALNEAIDKYIKDMTQGLFGLCEDEKERRIAEFTALHYPENGTQEEISAFYQKLLGFLKSLEAAAELQPREMLITSAAAKAAGDEMDCIAGAVRAKIFSAAQSGNIL